MILHLLNRFGIRARFDGLGMAIVMDRCSSREELSAGCRLDEAHMSQGSALDCLTHDHHTPPFRISFSRRDDYRLVRCQWRAVCPPHWTSTAGFLAGGSRVFEQRGVIQKNLFPHRDGEDIEQINHPSVRECCDFSVFRKEWRSTMTAICLPRTGWIELRIHSRFASSALRSLQGKMVSKSQTGHRCIYVEHELIRENVGAKDQVRQLRRVELPRIGRDGVFRVHRAARTDG